jgi:hypothetical protein
MKYGHLPATLGVTLLGLAACHDTTPPFTGAVRVANGITDSAGIDVTIKKFDSFQNIAVDTASSISFAPEDDYAVDLTSNGVTFEVSPVNVKHNRVATVFAYGTIASGSQGAFSVQESLDSPADGQSTMQTVHAAVLVSATAPTLNFYFVKPGTCAAAISSAATTGAATFNGTSTTFALAGSTYEICVADEGGKLLFDSGPAGIALPTSNSVNVFQLAAFDAPVNKGNGSSLVLSLLDNNGGSRVLYNLMN